MLPLWPNQLLITMGATHIALLHRTGFRKKTLALRELAIETQTTDSEVLILKALAHAIKAMAVPVNTQLYVSLTADLLRYIVLPATSEALVETDKLAYAQAAFQEIYGKEMLGWTIHSDCSAPMQPTLCVAIQQSLLDGLVALANDCNFKLKSVTPFFANAFNRFNKSFHRANGVFVVAENTRLLLATLQEGKCTQMRVHTLAEDLQTQLNACLTRISLLEDTHTHQAHIYAPTQAMSEFKSIHSWQIIPLILSKSPSALPLSHALLEVMR